MIITFGKHKGKRLEDIPRHYLVWVLRECNSASPALLAEIRRLVQADNEESESQAIAVPSLAKQWYRQLCREFHPDRGGSHEAMKAINRANELLLDLAGVAG